MREEATAFRPWMEALPEALKLPAGAFMPQEEWAWERIARSELADMALFDPTADRTAPDWWEGDPDGRRPDPSNPRTFKAHHILSERFLRTVIFHEPYASCADRPGVRIAHAWVTDGINWSGRSTTGELWFRQCRLDADVYLQDFKTPSALTFQGSHLRGGLYADRIQVGGGLFCNDGFIIEGEVRLLRAKIADEVAFRDATLKQAINADGIEIGGGLFCDQGFTCNGDFKIIGARIFGPLEFTAAELKKCLKADRLEAAGAVFCDDGFLTAGGISLKRARIGGALFFDKAQLVMALNAEGIEVSGSLFLRNVGQLGRTLLAGARIGGNLQIGQSNVKDLINLTGARFEGALELSQTAGSEPTWGENAGLILRNVTCGALAGSLAAFRRVRVGKAKKEHFPKLDLVGLRYANLGGLQAEQKDTLAGVTDANELIAFLEAGAGEGATFTPGPYQQLARELRDTGHDSMADKIMIAMKRHERVCSPHWRKIGLCFADEFSRFGYCNHRALAWFGFVVMGSCAVGLCLNGAVFTPTAEGWDNFVGWFWFALGNAIPLITLDDAHRTFLAEQFRTAPNAVPWGVASVFHIAKIFGFAILSYYVASLAGLANPRNE